jgi:hypothetical protein
MHTFAPTWISSHHHLRLLAQPYLNASWFRRYLSPPEPPPNFPQIRIGSKAVPLFFFATGKLEVDGTLVTFFPQHEPQYENVDDEFEFRVQLDRRMSIDRRFVESPILKRFSWSWIALRLPDLEDELLLCVGGTGLSVARIEKQTDELFRVLQGALGEPV